MSRDTEKVFRALHAFLEGKEFANEEDTNKAIQEFIISAVKPPASAVGI